MEVLHHNPNKHIKDEEADDEQEGDKVEEHPRIVVPFRLRKAEDSREYLLFQFFYAYFLLKTKKIRTFSSSDHHCASRRDTSTQAVSILSLTTFRSRSNPWKMFRESSTFKLFAAVFSLLLKAVRTLDAICSDVTTRD